MSNSTELLRGKKVIVIGGSSGIGHSVAAAALDHGATVIIASSSPERVNSAVERLQQGARNKDGVSVKGQAFDIKDFATLKSFLGQEGPFDHLVITAGRLPSLGFPNQEIDDNIKQAFDERYWSVIIAAQHIHKNNLINSGGSITLTTGIINYRPPPGWGMVTGIGGALDSSTRGLAVDLKPIRVNTISPGLVDTEIFAQHPPELRDGWIKEQSQKLPVGHVAKPEEVAEAYIFAMKCNYLTGQVIVVDGGGLIV